MNKVLQRIKDRCDKKSIIVKSEPSDKFTAVKNYVDKLEPAISGESGHDRTFEAACKLFKNFPSDIAEYGMIYFNQTKCSPAWSDRDLAHKMGDALKKVRFQGHSFRPIYQTLNNQTTHKLVPTISLPLPQPMDDAGRILLETCYLDGEMINLAVVAQDKRPLKDETRTREQWIETIQTNGIYNYFGTTNKNGVYVCINPLTDVTRRRESVSAFRHVLVESDELISKEDQYSILIASGLPISVIVDSGNKSIHAWVKINAGDHVEFELKRDIIYGFLEKFGIDKKNKDSVRYSRMAGEVRGDNIQNLLAVNVGYANFNDWVNDIKYHEIRMEAPSGVPITLFSSPEEGGEDELIRNRFLNRKGGMMLIGPSGIGKSTFSIGMAIQFALGNDYLGFQPTRPLKQLIIQGEDDKGDLGEMKDGVFRGMKIVDPIQIESLTDGVIIVTLNTAAGQKFLTYLDYYLHEYRPDVVWINPVLTYLGGDASNQKEVSTFIRSGLNPLLDKYNCGCILVHHTTKPPRDNTKNVWSGIDFSYYGLGSSDWSNWARAVVCLLNVGSDSTYQLKIGKRGKRLRWEDNAGMPILEKYISHSEDGVLCWRDATEEEVQEAKECITKDRETLESILSVIPTNFEYISQVDIIRESGRPDSTVRRSLVKLESKMKIVCDGDGRNKKWRRTRPDEQLTGQED
jgi:RecA-family ATPase